MKRLEYVRLVLGPVATNTYLLYDRDNRDTIIIDPSGKAEKIIQAVEDNKLKPKAILLTHGHFDHIMSADEVRRYYEIKIYGYEKEKDLFENGANNTSKRFSGKEFTVDVDIFFDDNTELKFLGYNFKVIHTPGHTKGSVCFYIEEEDLLISGDTLFCRSYGRCDLYSGNHDDMIESIKKLFLLKDETLVLPGHERFTNIADEKRSNEILRYI